MFLNIPINIHIPNFSQSLPTLIYMSFLYNTLTHLTQSFLHMLDHYITLTVKRFTYSF